MTVCSIDIDERGFGSLAIAEASGEVQSYRFEPIPRGMSLWAFSLRKVGDESKYTVRVQHGGKWECDCPAEKYRKRGADHCKHIRAATALRMWLESFLERYSEVQHER